MEEKSKRKQLKGSVLSDKMDKTRVVAVDRFISHQLYGKRIKVRKKYYIDDPKNEARTGDVVEFRECRPLSKQKRWRLQKIVHRANV